MFPEFSEHAAYLDIETTGLDRAHDTITTIALYDGSEIKWYVQGQNLDDFPRDIERYNLLISYNGSCFDVPFIERFFNIRLTGSANRPAVRSGGPWISRRIKALRKDFWELSAPA